jgi:hypothetical protein
MAIAKNGKSAEPINSQGKIFRNNDAVPFRVSVFKSDRKVVSMLKLSTLFQSSDSIEMKVRKPKKFCPVKTTLPIFGLSDFKSEKGSGVQFLWIEKIDCIFAAVLR